MRAVARAGSACRVGQRRFLIPSVERVSRLRRSRQRDGRVRRALREARIQRRIVCGDGERCAVRIILRRAAAGRRPAVLGVGRLFLVRRARRVVAAVRAVVLVRRRVRRRVRVGLGHVVRAERDRRVVVAGLRGRQRAARRRTVRVCNIVTVDRPVRNEFDVACAACRDRHGRACISLSRCNDRTRLLRRARACDIHHLGKLIRRGRKSIA